MRPTPVRRTYRDVWLASATAVVALGWVGALVARPVRATIWSFVVTAVLGGLGTIMYELRDGHAPMPGRRLAWITCRRGVMLAAAIVAFTGYAEFVHGWSLLLVLIAAVTSPRLFDYLRALREAAVPDDRPAEAPPSAGSAGPTPTRPVSSMAVPELCHAWRSSYLDLQNARTSCARMRIVAARQEYLDELERRNRNGFEHWLESGARAASDPGRYVWHRHDQDH